MMLILYYMFLTLAVVFVACLCLFVASICYALIYNLFKAFQKNKDYDINNAIELLSEHYNVSESYVVNVLSEGRELNE